MQTIESIKIRVRQILDDPNGDRFSDTLLENAIRQALIHLDEQLPLVVTLELPISTTGRDQTLTGLKAPLYIIQVAVLSASSSRRERVIKTGYSYTLEGETGKLHFDSLYFPHGGEILRVMYSAQNKLAGLDGAEETTAPEAASAALETGSASFACLLRAASLAEAYGARTGESARLVEQSRVWKEASEGSMSKLKNFQSFEYPNGFVLDRWDR